MAQGVEGNNGRGQERLRDFADEHRISEKSGGICGPALLVGLAILPLALRRRR
ncbi:CGP-CTERM sorting domain-containing protein [Thermococcus sp. JCM 11816]|uniref:CGP-CTERM sorting domain-containing protein n=1 Tax=Thermococcus sp. (strain JCM 11816 / KS-1) TaxID=1295125 RepID=UPI0034652CC0